jgi:leader peptidase (prepilin peptidase)/N-methyltransferase
VQSFTAGGKEVRAATIIFGTGAGRCNQGAKTGQETVFWVATLGLTGVLIAIAVIDLRSFRIPDVLSLPLIAAGLVLAWVQPLMPFWHHLIGAAVGFALLAGVGEWYFRQQGVDGLGLGDAKLFAAAGAWLGWQALPAVLLIAALGGLGFALRQRGATRGTAIAFGPWLALGFWLVWLWSKRAILLP